MSLKFKVVEKTLNNGTKQETLWVKQGFFSEWKLCYKTHHHSLPDFSINCVEFSTVVKPDQFKNCIEYLSDKYKVDQGNKVKTVKERKIK
jgi:hypothetical protein